MFDFDMGLRRTANAHRHPSPGPVPAGQYAKEALTKLGLWDSLQSRLVLGGDVGAVLQYAKRGEVAAAIVYETEAKDVSDVVILDRAAGDWAPTLEVVVGVVPHSIAALKEAAALDRHAGRCGRCPWYRGVGVRAIVCFYGLGPSATCTV